MPNVSIAISAQDNFSSAITKMKNTNNAFSKDLDGTLKKLDSLNKNRTELKLDLKKAKNELKDAEKQFLKTGDAADKLEYEMKSANYDNVNQNLRLVSKNAKEAEKQALNLTNAVSKADNRAGFNSSSNGMLSTLAKSGLTQLVGQSLTESANVLVNSAFGSDAGTMFSSTLGGAVSGAAMGSLAGPLGTAIGGAVGAAAGAISGATKNYEKKDDYFKSVVRQLYEDTQAGQETSMTSGSATAAGREIDAISFSTLLGDAEKSEEYLEQLVDFAAKTPFEYETLTDMSKVLLTYGYTQEELLPLLENVGDTGAALGMTPQDMAMVSTSLGRMKSSDKATLEYLNLMLERGVSVIDYIAEEKNVSVGEVYDMISKGEISGKWASELISGKMAEDYSGSMQQQSETFSGLEATLSDAMTDLNAIMGEGYNEERKEGLEKEIAFYDTSTESGKKMADAYASIGEWEASLENKKEEMIRDAITEATNSTEFTAAKAAGDGAEMGRIIATAKAKAETDFMKTDEYAQMMATQTETVEDIRRETTLSKAWELGYDYEQEFSKGRVSAQVGTEADEYDNVVAKAFANPPPPFATQFATGINRVPYTGLFTLHEDEAVIPASKSRGRYGSGVNITGNSFIVREEADINKIAEQIAKKIRRQYELVG